MQAEANVKETPRTEMLRGRLRRLNEDLVNEIDRLDSFADRLLGPVPIAGVVKADASSQPSGILSAVESEADSLLPMVSRLSALIDRLNKVA